MDYMLDYLQDLTGTPLRPALGFPLPFGSLFVDPVTPARPESSSSSSSSSFARRGSSPSSPVAVSPVASPSSSSSQLSESSSSPATSPATSPAPPSDPESSTSTGPITRKRAREMQGGAAAKEKSRSDSTQVRSSARNIKPARRAPNEAVSSSPSSSKVEVPATPRSSRKRTAAVVDEEEEEEPEAGPSSSSSDRSAKRPKVKKEGEPTPAPRGFRKERASRKEGAPGLRRPTWSGELEVFDVPLDKPDASGATSFPFMLGTSERQELDSMDKFYAVQKFFEQRIEEKAAEIAAQRAERGEPPLTRASSWAPYAVKTSKARKRASAAASTSKTKKEAESSDPESDSDTGRFVPSKAIARSMRGTRRDEATELESDDQAALVPGPTSKAVVKSRKGKKRAGASQTGRRRRQDRSPSPDDGADAADGAFVHVGDADADADPFRPGEIRWRIHRSGSNFCDTSVTCTEYTDGRILDEVCKGRW